jgi:hypothetical protein
MLYKKKPVVVEAIQWDGTRKGIAAIESAFNNLETNCTTYDMGDIYSEPISWTIYTLEGLITATPGDYIIKGIKGEFYPCKPDVFELTYELA